MNTQDFFTHLRRELASTADFAGAKATSIPSYYGVLGQLVRIDDTLAEIRTLLKARQTTGNKTKLVEAFRNLALLAGIASMTESQSLEATHVPENH